MTTIKAPAGFVPSESIGFGDVDGTYTAVSASNPLPVITQPLTPATNTAIPGSDATTATAVQGITGGKAIPVSAAQLPSSLGTKTAANSISTAPASDAVFPLPATFTVGPVTTVSTINTDLLTNTVNGWYDAGAYHTGSISIFTTAGISAGVVTFEQTNDTTNASSGIVMNVFDSSAANLNTVTSLTLAASTVKQYEFPILARYIRVRVSTGVVGGTVGATAVFSQQPYAATRITVVQQTAGNLNVIATGNAAEDAATTDKGVIGAGVVRTTTSPVTLVAGDAARVTMTNGAALVTKAYSVPQADWMFNSTLTTTTAAQAKAAGAASIRNYVTAFQYQNTNSTATTILILDNVTTIHQLYAPANMDAPVVMTFPTPLQGTAATALNLNCGTTGASVLVNLQGYQAA